MAKANNNGAKAKVIRVEVEFEDGKVIRLTGRSAGRWQEAVESQSFLAFAHGRAFPRLRWQRVRRPHTTE